MITGDTNRTAIGKPRSSEVVYQYAKGTLVEAPSARLDLSVSFLPGRQAIKFSLTMRSNGTDKLPSDLPPLTRLFKSEPLLAW